MGSWEDLARKIRLDKDRVRTFAASWRARPFITYTKDGQPVTVTRARDSQGGSAWRVTYYAQGREDGRWQPAGSHDEKNFNAAVKAALMDSGADLDTAEPFVDPGAKGEAILERVDDLIHRAKADEGFGAAPYSSPRWQDVIEAFEVAADAFEEVGHTFRADSIRRHIAYLEGKMSKGRAPFPHSDRDPKRPRTRSNVIPLFPKKKRTAPGALKRAVELHATARAAGTRALHSASGQDSSFWAIRANEDASRAYSAAGAAYVTLKRETLAKMLYATAKQFASTAAYFKKRLRETGRDPQMKRGTSPSRPATTREKALLVRALKIWRPGVGRGCVKVTGAKPAQFDQTQLAIGTAVEMEHTRLPAIALEIAMAHLLESRRYYVALERMERGLVKKPTADSLQPSARPRARTRARSRS